MGIVATDLIIKSMLEAAIEDLRANTWVLEHIFSDLADDAMSAPESGWKEVRTAIDWFLKTDIPVITQHRIADAPKIPCISIAYEPSNEMDNRASLGDEGGVEDYILDRPGKGTVAVIKITKNFTPDEYDITTGEVVMPKGINTDLMSVGNYFVATNGHSYKIQAIHGSDRFKLLPNITDDFTNAYVAPRSNVWNAHKELTFLKESYSIGCHTQNDPGTTIWLWQIIFYSMLRYKEAFLESRGFEISTLQSSGLVRNTELQTENVFSKYITISGEVEASWIKFIAPKFESVAATFNVDAPDAIDTDYVYGDDAEECPPGWATGDDFVDQEFDEDDEDDC
ncbi:MAG: hypothetical protein DRN30_04570 [Thermoplasmata archaeon]|nr:MAG: hypothetical protein DRN30_04570 [Thermoplasmata archaeon]